MTAVYLTVFVIGALGLASALIAETDHGDGLPFLSLNTLAAALLGGGTGGLISDWAGLGTLSAALIPRRRRRL